MNWRSILLTPFFLTLLVAGQALAAEGEANSLHQPSLPQVAANSLSAPTPVAPQPQVALEQALEKPLPEPQATALADSENKQDQDNLPEADAENASDEAATAADQEDGDEAELPTALTSLEEDNSDQVSKEELEESAHQPALEEEASAEDADLAKDEADNQNLIERDLEQAVDEAGPEVLAQTQEVADIPLYTNRKIEAFIRMYTGRKRDVFEQAIERSAKYMPMIQRIFKEQGLPANLAYLAVVESNFNPKARSHANAVGLWQFMRYTGKLYDLDSSWWHDERFDPEKSTLAAAQYLKSLYRQFGSWELAMAAYNCGAGKVRSTIRKNTKKGLSTDYWALKLPRETRGYVPSFYAVLTLFENLEAYGFQQPPPAQELPERDFIQVPGGVALKQVAEETGIPLEVIEELNPSLPRGLTPANTAVYELAVPLGTKADEAALAQKLTVHRTAFWKYHQVRRGDTLWRISRRYGIPIEQIVSFNDMSRRRVLRINQKIMLPVPEGYRSPEQEPVYQAIPAKPDKREGFVYYSVKKGDSLWSIAISQKVTITEILQWNKRLRRKGKLKVGQEIALKPPKLAMK